MARIPSFLRALAGCIALLLLTAAPLHAQAPDGADPAEQQPSPTEAPDPLEFADEAGPAGSPTLAIAGGAIVMALLVGIVLVLSRRRPAPHVDGLTGLANRRRLDRDLPGAFSHAEEVERTIGIVMIDVDHFKTYNDTNGHAAGDEALRRVAYLLRANVRDQDVVYRYGGEEFCVMLPDTTDDEARSVAERLRAAVEDAPFDGEDRQPGGTVTISVGLALTEGGDPATALRSADGALNEAKHGGRNRVVVVLGPDGPGLLLS